MTDNITITVKPNADQDVCKHPPDRHYAWTAYDNTLVVCCCDCGRVLQGGVGLAEE